jgi:hypothetical protein
VDFLIIASSCLFGMVLNILHSLSLTVFTRIGGWAVLKTVEGEHLKPWLPNLGVLPVCRAWNWFGCRGAVADKQSVIKGVYLILFLKLPLKIPNFSTIIFLSAFNIILLLIWVFRLSFLIDRTKIPNTKFSLFFISCPSSMRALFLRFVPQ